MYQLKFGSTQEKREAAATGKSKPIVEVSWNEARQLL